MRIGLIGPVYPYRGGIAHYTTMLCKALRAGAHDVLMVSFKRQYPQWIFPGNSDKDPSEDSLKLRDVQYWIDSLNPLTWLLTSARLCRHQPDIIIMQWWTTFWTPVWLAIAWATRLVLHKPLIIICHNVLPHEARWWDSLLARLVLGQATHLIVQSKDERNRLLSLIPGADVDIVQHPIYDMFDDRNVSKEQARSQLGLPLDVPILLFFGIIREYKGLEELLRALPKVQSVVGRTRLIVAGEFWEDRGPYIELIETTGISESVILEDRYIPNEEVAIYFSAADVLVAPYRRATGSGVVQLARGLGVPAVTTIEAGGGANQAIQGLLVRPGDVQALAGAIIKVLTRRRDTPSKLPKIEDSKSSWDALVEVIQDVSSVQSEG